MPADPTSSARRRLGETAREYGSLVGAGLVIWCDTVADPESADVVTAALGLLEVPHQLVRVARPPRRPGHPPRPGSEARIPQGQALETLKRQAPSLLRLVSRGRPVDSEFDLAVWDLDEVGAVVPAGAAGRAGRRSRWD
ncbi:hypothetical protein [Kitasatospora sp. NPDC058218]|uniref:hypothetical protein n=1 Tax=Kitasatospora sp. NPDC058218 TaxID=3346385 RepID=UPI0036DA9217